MKFGQRIRQEEAACLHGPLMELSDHFLRYKEMKKMIKRITQAGSDEEALANAESKFSDLLITEMVRIYDFFDIKIAEYAQVNAKILKSRSAQCLTIAAAQEMLASTSAMPSARCCTDPSRSPADMMLHLLDLEEVKKHASAPLLRDLHNLAGKVSGLKRFATINTLGCIKISKKHDKHSTIALQQRVSARLFEKPIVNTPKLVILDNSLRHLSIQLCTRLLQETGLASLGPIADLSEGQARGGGRANKEALEFSERGEGSAHAHAHIHTHAHTHTPAASQNPMYSFSHHTVAHFNPPANALLSNSLPALSSFPPSITHPLSSTLGPFHTHTHTRPLSVSLSSLVPSNFINSHTSSNVHTAHDSRISGKECAPASGVGGMRGGNAFGKEAGEGSGQKGAKRCAREFSDSGDEQEKEEGEEGEGDVQEGEGVTLVRPRMRRRKEGHGGQHALGGKPHDPSVHVDSNPVTLSADSLRTYFNLPLVDAARKMGICATAIKKVCRKMGIRRWPFQALKPIERRLQTLQEKVDAAHKLGHQPPPTVTKEIQALNVRRELLMTGGAGAKQNMSDASSDD
eukprot:CAMPEP_0179421502 /NCGR_PEP_ID=MMETSP0799-20121207/9822_1 /TAXON_ID=46947 /ORGANISM="Geminigera cryophila, Strain CCMP2564" /LENGTH=572 /DNA_ID=CAMNT_0021195357 /DNA_START=82 /DNA_END=1800 /DNA_ORIENTATION=+